MFGAMTVKKAFHISRIEVSETDIREKQLPPELKY